MSIYVYIIYIYTYIIQRTTTVTPIGDSKRVYPVPVLQVYAPPAVGDSVGVGSARAVVKPLVHTATVNR